MVKICKEMRQDRLSKDLLSRKKADICGEGGPFQMNLKHRIIFIRFLDGGGGGDRSKKIEEKIECGKGVL